MKNPSSPLGPGNRCRYATLSCLIVMCTTSAAVNVDPPAYFTVGDFWIEVQKNKHGYVTPYNWSNLGIHSNLEWVDCGIGWLSNEQVPAALNVVLHMKASYYGSTHPRDAFFAYTQTNSHPTLRGLLNSMYINLEGTGGLLGETKSVGQIDPPKHKELIWIFGNTDAYVQETYPGVDLKVPISKDRWYQTSNPMFWKQDLAIPLPALWGWAHHVVDHGVGGGSAGYRLDWGQPIVPNYSNWKFWYDSYPPPLYSFFVSVNEAGTTNELESFVTTLFDSEDSVVASNLELGEYDLYVSYPGALRKAFLGVSNSNGASALVYDPVKGDGDGDNEIGPGDFGLLSQAVGLSSTDDEWDQPIAGGDIPAYQLDFDEDGEIGPGDFGIVSSNFGQSGD